MARPYNVPDPVTAERCRRFYQLLVDLYDLICLMLGYEEQLQLPGFARRDYEPPPPSCGPPPPLPPPSLPDVVLDAQGGRRPRVSVGVQTDDADANARVHVHAKRLRRVVQDFAGSYDDEDSDSSKETTSTGTERPPASAYGHAFAITVVALFVGWRYLANR